MSAPFTPVLERLARERGVHGGLVVGQRDGLVIEAYLQLGIRAEPIAALAASIYRKARLSADAAGLGEVRYVELVAERGRLCMTGRDDLVLVAVTDAHASIGLLRAGLLRAREALA